MHISHISQAGLDTIRLFEGAPLSKEFVNNLEKELSQLVTAPINQNQFDALFSFASNMGVDKLTDSKLLKRINALEDPSEVAKEELHKWNKEGNKVFQGLSRRRAAELELFCQKPPEFKWGWVSMTSKNNTWLKKRPLPALRLKSDEKAKVYGGRAIRRCYVLEREDHHTFLELGFGLGKWWVYDNHWKGLKTEISVQPYAKDNDLVYLREFPYEYYNEDEIKGWRRSQAFCMAMVLKYLDAEGINGVNDYINLLNKRGSNGSRDAHLQSIRTLGYTATFNQSVDPEDIKDNIKRGLPVIASVISKKHISNPKGGAHYVVITGYGYDYWLVQDPFGELDLIDGGWKDRSAEAGKNIKYNYEHFNRRLFVAGGATGWCWTNFRNYLNTVED